MDRARPMAVADHIEALRLQGPLLEAALDGAGPDRPVPSCPDWALRDLARHLGGVHRWATGIVTGQLAEPWKAELDDVVGQWPADPDLGGWLTAGLEALVGALSAAPADLDCWTFLAAPSPRAMWARRQAHETTVHRVDAEQALAGAVGAADVTPVDRALAADGVDELLRCFVTRPRSRLRADPPRSLGVTCADVDRSWLLQTSAQGVEASVGPPPSADCQVRGPAADLYLTLWNRQPLDPTGLEIGGDPAVLAWVLDHTRVTWS